MAHEKETPKKSGTRRDRGTNITERICDLFPFIETNITAGDAPSRVPRLRNGRRDSAPEWITAIHEICLRGYVWPERVSRGRARIWRDGLGLCRDALG